MEKNTNIKQIFIMAGIAFGFVAILAGGILVFGKTKYGGNKVAGTSTQGTADDMAGMHGPPPPADNSKFQSLLNNPAPDFKLTSYDGKEINLSDYKGKNIVLFFSEGAMCYPSCWDQIDAFTKDKNFAEENTVVLTVVVDPKPDWDAVVKQDPKIANATVLLDSDKKVSAQYGVLTVESSMHRGQFPGHTYIVIDKQGVVRYELDDPNMGINNTQLLAQVGKL